MIISSVKNEFVKQAKSLKQKKYRMERGEFIAEGVKCVNELLLFMPQNVLSIIFCGEKYNNCTDKLKSEFKIYSVSESVFASISDEKSPQGIAATARIPVYNNVHSGFIVMLDGVSDPQNIGTIIRTADAGGCSCVVLSKQCADCFSPKAVRASMGSIFHIPVIKADLGDYIRKLKALGYIVAAADVKGNADFNIDGNKTCLVIGNESKGISDYILSVSDVRVGIPMYGKAESLNAAVAAGILIYKIRT